MRTTKKKNAQQDGSKGLSETNKEVNVNQHSLTPHLVVAKTDTKEMANGSIEPDPTLTKDLIVSKIDKEDVEFSLSDDSYPEHLFQSLGMDEENFGDWSSTPFMDALDRIQEQIPTGELQSIKDVEALDDFLECEDNEQKILRDIARRYIFERYELSTNNLLITT